MHGFDFSYLADIAVSVLPALMCITIHECSHGLAAFFLGDPTAKRCGRITLNPVRHIDIMGLAMILICRVGWAKPVPININNFKRPRLYTALTALAGPLSNLISAAVFLFFYGALYIPLYGSGAGLFCLKLIAVSAQLSIGLCLFNLIPFPPLDGAKLVFSLLDDTKYRMLLNYEKYIGIALFVLVWSGVISTPLSRLISYVYSNMFVIAQQSCEAVLSLFYS